MYFAVHADGTPVMPGEQIGSVGSNPETPLHFVSAGPDRIHTRAGSAGRPACSPTVFNLRIVGPGGHTFPALTDGETLPPVRHSYDRTPDGRYTVGTCFTGEYRPELTTGVPGQTWVAQFCDEWIGPAPTKAGAWVLAYYHAAAWQYGINGHAVS